MRHLFLIILLVMTFRNFQFFPGMGPIQEIWFVLCFIFLLNVYPYWKSKTQWRFSLFELYLLAMMLIIPLLAGISAWLEFGQPIEFGILSQRNVTVYAGILLLIHGFRHRYFTSHDVERSLLFWAWGTLILYLIIRSTLDPAMYSNYGKGFVEGEGEKAFFKLPGLFLVFGFYYYGFLGFRKQNINYYLIAVLFLISSLGDRGARTFIVALLISFIVFIYRWGRLTRLISFIPKMLFLGFFILAVWYVANSDDVLNRAEEFSDAFKVVFTDEEVEDVSAQARIFETISAIPYIQKHPIIGNGNISNQWNDGFAGVLGDYFHLSDIGVLGVLFEYGAIGVLLFGLQYWFVIKEIASLPSNINNPLLDATKAFLLFTAIYSLTTGISIYNAEVSFLFIALLGSIGQEIRISNQLAKTIQL